jgi:hypothetical protein
LFCRVFCGVAGLAFVKPCQNEDLAPNSNPIERLCEGWMDLQSGGLRAFPPLFRTAFTRPERGTHDSSRPQQIWWPVDFGREVSKETSEYVGDDFAYLKARFFCQNPFRLMGKRWGRYDLQTDSPPESSFLLNPPTPICGNGI